MELSSLKIKKFLIFSQKTVFLIFWDMKLSSPKFKKFLYFFKKNFAYISGGDLQNLKN